MLLDIYPEKLLSNGTSDSHNGYRRSIGCFGSLHQLRTPWQAATARSLCTQLGATCTHAAMSSGAQMQARSYGHVYRCDTPSVLASLRRR